MNEKAKLIDKSRRRLPGGGLIEWVIWQVPTPVPPATHNFKYRLVYIRDGKRVVGFDNERGKGDHMHLDEQELPYTFSSIKQLLADFFHEITQRGAQ